MHKYLGMYKQNKRYRSELNFICNTEFNGPFWETRGDKTFYLQEFSYVSKERIEFFLTCSSMLFSVQ